MISISIMNVAAPSGHRPLRASNAGTLGRILGQPWKAATAVGHHPVILIPGTETRSGDSFGKRLHDVMLRFLTEVMYPSILALPAI
jgi:hypothetical protein